MTSSLLKEKEDGLLMLTLNRADAANSLDRQLLTELKETLTEAMFNRDIRCLIITASGGKVFCAGADLKERRTLPESEVPAAVAHIGDTISLIEKMPFPVIAAMNGSAFGGGLELALACDFRLASVSASFGLTETSLAIIPGAGGTQRLPRLVGIQRAKEMIYTAKKISAGEAERIGLIMKAVPAGEVLRESRKLAHSIMENGPVAVRQAKKAIELGMETSLENGLAIERLCYRETIPTEDRLEALNAFAEKRRPIFKGE
ncbi:MAG: enoyl-CoA hydratase-related protein [Bacillus sp. (in: firmicutes)]